MLLRLRDKECTKCQYLAQVQWFELYIYWALNHTLSLVRL